VRDMSRKIEKAGLSRAFGIRTVAGMLAFGGVRALANAFSWTHWSELNWFMDGLIDRGGTLERRGRRVWVEETPRLLGVPVCAELRPGTSDIRVWRQIVQLEEFAAVVGLLRGRPVRTILDAGANIGLTSLYLAHAFPDARILALEPDDANHALLVDNLRAVSDRVECVQGAFWPIEERLRMNPVPFRDGREWSGQVERGEAGAGGGTMEVLTPEAADTRLGGSGFDLLKIDIEGAESEFFTDPDHTEALLSRAAVIAIEVHEEHMAPHAVLRALDAAGFLVFPSGELLIGLRRDPGA
jgi:FkbM family methyltransferase